MAIATTIHPNGVVKLGKRDIAWAKVIAGMRTSESVRMNLNNQKSGFKERDMTMEFLGCCGELAYCRYAGLEWTADINTFKAPDTPDGLQVRTTEHQKGHLIIRDGDPLGDTYVLVVGTPPMMKVIGSIKGSIVGRMTKTVPRNSKGNTQPCWMIPQCKLIPISWGGIT